jgi:hypothetical protein
MPSGEDLVDIAQTVALVVISMALLYGMALLRSELKRASGSLAAVLRGQKTIQDTLAEHERRLQLLEQRS